MWDRTQTLLCQRTTPTQRHARTRQCTRLPPPRCSGCLFIYQYSSHKTPYPLALDLQLSDQRPTIDRGGSGFGIANDRGTVAVEWKHHRCDRLKRRRDLSVEVSVLRGWDPKVPVGPPVSFPKRSNPAWRLVAPSSPCRINTKSKHQSQPGQS